MRLILNKVRNLDTFSKNIILVFAGTTLVNLFNFLSQLLIAHKFPKADFAAFNSLLSIFMLISAPLLTVQTAVVKYTAEFNAGNQVNKVKELLSALLKKLSVLAILAILFFYFASPYIMDKLKIYSGSCGYILAMLVASACIIPVFWGGLQGLEKFNWLMSLSTITGLIKLILIFVFIMMGFNIAGALGGFLIANLLFLGASIFPLRTCLSFKPSETAINYKEFFFYMLPVAISSFCFMSLITSDMILVKYFFAPEEAGLYSLAQMVGKVFLFLPIAIVLVMFPRASVLNAKNLDTVPTLKRSVLYAGILCFSSALIYNLFPGAILKVMTGKAFPESIFLGRLFSISMSFFTLLSILTAYFLSLKDLRFLKYLAFFTGLEFLAIIFFHKDLIQVQVTLCVTAVLVFLIHLMLVFNGTGKYAPAEHR